MKENAKSIEKLEEKKRGLYKKKLDTIKKDWEKLKKKLNEKV